MAGGVCQTCGSTKINCGTCGGRGYIESDDGREETCYRCDGYGRKCPNASRTTDC